MRALVVVAFLGIAGCKGEEKPGHASHGEAVAQDAGNDHAAHGTLPEGYAEVAIPAERQQRIGLGVAAAERVDLGGEVRATATVQVEEKREAHVHSRLMGYVRQLHVNAVGQKVKKGQPLYSIYSQELLVAQHEYLRARKFGTDLADAARDRLRLWEIPEDQIQAMEARGKPLETVVVRAPIGGTVIEKNVVKGHFVEPDMMLFHIADLSRVWVIADVYEYELGRIDRTGKARIRVEGIERTFEAPIDYVYPTVDPATRTIKVRLVVANPDGALRPGNFAQAELPTVRSEVVAVPEDAVIDTGTRQLVYVAQGEGRFRPVEVEVGRRVDGRAEIRRGLSEGDQVVVRAQFLVDSESRLGAAGRGRGHGGGH